MPRLMQAAEQQTNRPRGRAKSVILFNLLGGPSHMDMFDLKPLAPSAVRGEFNPIATSANGIHICEHLPNTAKLMHKACLIRTISHSYNSHDPLPIMTGFTGGNAALQNQPNYPPDIGAIPSGRRRSESRFRARGPNPLAARGVTIGVIPAIPPPETVIGWNDRDGLFWRTSSVRPTSILSSMSVASGQVPCSCG